MLLTILLSVMMMAGLFLMLLGGVGFIQDKRFFSSAPKEVYDAVPDQKPERFPGQHVLGWALAVIAILLFPAALFLGAWDGVWMGFTFWQFVNSTLLLFSH